MKAWIKAGVQQGNFMKLHEQGLLLDGPSQRPNQLAILSKKLEVRTINANVKDDFTSFINSDATDIPPDCTPLEWWCQPQQRKQYPKLSRMAISILSIPAESSEPERTFSGARRTCSWDRLRITCKTIEMIECTGNWLRQGLIRPLHENGMGLIGIPRPEGDSPDVDDNSGHYFDWYQSRCARWIFLTSINRSFVRLNRLFVRLTVCDIFQPFKRLRKYSTV